uniref:ACB domain-containing protein n=1 Tax=Strongyloides papillosus TaxID=174720 RepID=A0A0N5BMR2_STREA
MSSNMQNGSSTHHFDEYKEKTWKETEEVVDWQPIAKDDKMPDYMKKKYLELLEKEGIQIGSTNNKQ